MSEFTVGMPGIMSFLNESKYACLFQLRCVFCYKIFLSHMVLSPTGCTSV